MQCPRCQAENEIGAAYCIGCGARMELTDLEAHDETVAAARHEAWQRVFHAMNRALFLFVVVFIGAMLFRAYANREVRTDFRASVPLPPQPPVALAPVLAQPVNLPLSAPPAAASLHAEKPTEAEIIDPMAADARERLACNIVLARGTGAVKGTLLSRTADEVLVIVDWGPPLSVRSIKTGDIDFGKSKLPAENIK